MENPLTGNAKTCQSLHAAAANQNPGLRKSLIKREIPVEEKTGRRAAGRET
jgi:hypothetical protein